MAGLAGLAVGTFQYTQRRDVVKVGPIQVQAKEKETVTSGDSPWAQAAVVAILGIPPARAATVRRVRRSVSDGASPNCLA